MSGMTMIVLKQKVPAKRKAGGDPSVAIFRICCRSWKFHSRGAGLLRGATVVEPADSEARARIRPGFVRASGEARAPDGRGAHPVRTRRVHPCVARGNAGCTPRYGKPGRR